MGTGNDLLACVLHPSERSMGSMANIEQLSIEEHRHKAQSLELLGVLLCSACDCILLSGSGNSVSGEFGTTGARKADFELSAVASYT